MIMYMLSLLRLHICVCLVNTFTTQHLSFIFLYVPMWGMYYLFPKKKRYGRAEQSPQKLTLHNLI